MSPTPTPRIPSGGTAGLFDLTGKVALVTGGNAGLGLSFATAIAKAGGDVIIWGRRKDRNEQAAALLRKHGGRVLAQKVDVSQESGVVDAMEEAIVQLGRLDCVIVNAGINSWPASFVELESEEYLRVLATNQHGAFYTLREAVRHMTTRAKEGDPGGSLIVCGSLTVVAGVGRIEHYSASKGALMGMTRSIAVEYRHQGIRANMLLPGRIASDLPGASRSEITEGFERIPIPRQGTPQDLEGIVVYLMSDASAHHTGDMIAIDGGLSITLPGRDGHRTSSDTGTRPQ